MEIKSQKLKSVAPESAPAAKAPDLKDIVNVDPLQQGQALLAAGKKRKKRQKRAGLCLNFNRIVFTCRVLQIWVCFLLLFTDKLATKLSDTLTSAMDFSFCDS